MNVNTEIRTVQDADFDALAELYTYYAKNTSYTYYAKEATASYMKSLLVGKGHDCAVVVAGQKVLGYVHISPGFSMKGGRCEIAIYLLPEYTGMGLGRQLALHGMKLARDMGYTQMGASVCTENSRSLGLFNSLGFMPTSTKYNAAFKFGRELHTQLFEMSLVEPFRRMP